MHSLGVLRRKRSLASTDVTGFTYQSLKCDMLSAHKSQKQIPVPPSVMFSLAKSPPLSLDILEFSFKYVAQLLLPAGGGGMGVWGGGGGSGLAFQENPEQSPPRFTAGVLFLPRGRRSTMSRNENGMEKGGSGEVTSPADRKIRDLGGWQFPNNRKGLKDRHTCL